MEETERSGDGAAAGGVRRTVRSTPTTHTALNFRHWTVADPDGICTRTPWRALVFRRVRLRSIRVLTASKVNSGEKQTRVTPVTSAVALARPFDISGPWSPSVAPLSRRASARFRIPFSEGNGDIVVEEVTSSSLPEKESQEKTDQGIYVLYP